MEHPDIIKYVNGETSDEESERILGWMKDHENDPEIREILGYIWTHASIKLTGEKPDFELLLQQVREQINARKTKRLRMIRWKDVYLSFSRIAAVLIVPLIVLSVFLYIKNSDLSRNTGSAILEHELHTKAGTRTKITLEDGTLVWLHDGTTFKYPGKFDKKERRVFVDGEAYFEVAANPKSPFIVDNPMMKTIVTGTRFNLNAYSADEYFEATLLEGKIHLQNDQQTYQLEPGRQIQYDKQTGKVAQMNVNSSSSTAWINGKLILEDESLPIALKKISRWYNIEIIVQDPELKSYLLTATIDQEKPEQTLRLISFALPVDYSVKTRQNGSELIKTFYLKKR
ncbi:FecR family protein [Gaoshiqia sp. Z1-71]|uniref:FecR family protein n=1 Tax=Gaoshiqia hydrogeniformans TaxID=3290090 RepID=UPI003BF86841